MKRLFSFLMVALFSASMWALQGGTLTSSKTPIDPTETVTLTYNGAGTMFANGDRKCYIHAWLLDKDGKNLPYGTDWVTCENEGEYNTKVAANRKMEQVGAATSGVFKIDINIKSFFSVTDEDVEKIAQLGVIVLSQWSNWPADNQTSDMFLSVGKIRYYMKNNWGGGEWSWEEMTKNGDNYELNNVVFGGTGVNYNTAAKDEGQGWIPVENFLGDKTIGLYDTVTFVLDPAAGTVTATLLGKYVEPTDPDYYLKNNWDGGDWDWKKMDNEGEGVYSLKNVVFGGSGVNYNTVASGDGTWVTVDAFLGDAIGALDTVDLSFNATSNKITAKLLGKYVPKIKLFGSFAGEEWTDGDLFDVAVDGKSASLTMEKLAAGIYRFKVKKDGVLLGKANSGDDYGLNRDWKGVSDLGDGEDALSLTADKAGDYVFTFTLANDSLGIDFPNLVSSAVTYSNPSHGTLSVKKGETPVASGSDVEEMTELTISASADEGYEVTALRAYKTDGEEPEAINEGKLIMPAYAITVTADIEQKGKYYISGDSAFVVDAGLGLSQKWNPKAIKATENVLVIKNLKEGVPYQIALTEDGDWSTKKNYNNLTAKPACLRDEDGDNHNIGFTLKTAGDVTITYVTGGSVFTVKGDFVMPTLALAGTFSKWSQLPMDIAADSLSASIAVNLTAGVDSFKIVKDGSWLSLNGEGETNYRVTRKWPQAPHVNLVNVGRNFVIDVDKAGEYIFKWTYSEDSLFVTFPALENEAVSITNLKYGSIIVKNGEASVASGANIQENTILTVTAASNSDVDYEVSNLRAFKTGDESTVVEINELHQLKMPGYAITITADERENSYIMAGSLALFGAEWDATAEANKMTRQSNGTYQLVKKEVALTAGETYEYKLTRNEKYILPAEGNYYLTNVLRSGEYTLTFTYIPSSGTVQLDTVLTKEEEVVPVVSIATEVNEWSVTADQLVISGDKKTASKVIELTEGVHVFQVVKGIWLGKENMTVTRAANTSIDFSKDNEDTEIYIWADVTGEYTFTWTYETSQLDITYPAAPSPTSAWMILGENVGGEGETWQTLVLTKAGDGKKASVAVNLEGDKNYEFKFIIGNDYRGLDGAESTKYTFHRGHKAAVGASGDSENNMLLQADWAGEYTFTWTYESNGISIGFPDEPDINYYIAGDFTNWGKEKEIMIESDGIWSASFDLEAETTYHFQVVKVQGSKETWYGANYEYNDMKYGDCSNWLLYTEAPRFDINLTTTKQASYPFYFEPTKQTVSVTIQEQGGETGVDNADATVKAVKTLENGMLIIEKNGVRYNAQGQVIK